MFLNSDSIFRFVYTKFYITFSGFQVYISFSGFQVLYFTFHIPHSISHIPYSVVRISNSVFRSPYFVIRIPISISHIASHLIPSHLISPDSHKRKRENGLPAEDSSVAVVHVVEYVTR